VVVAAMALSLLGVIGEFELSSETFTVCSERLDQFFVANNIGSYPTDASEAVIAATAKKKVAVMISVIGKKTYGVFRDLCSYVSYYSSILNLNDWRSQNPIDSIAGFRKKTKPSLFTAPI